MANWGQAFTNLSQSIPTMFQMHQQQKNNELQRMLLNEHIAGAKVRKAISDIKLKNLTYESAGIDPQVAAQRDAATIQAMISPTGMFPPIPQPPEGWIRGIQDGPQTPLPPIEILNASAPPGMKIPLPSGAEYVVPDPLADEATRALIDSRNRANQPTAGQPKTLSAKDQWMYGHLKTTNPENADALFAEYLDSGKPAEKTMSAKDQWLLNYLKETDPENADDRFAKAMLEAKSNTNLALAQQLFYGMSSSLLSPYNIKTEEGRKGLRDFILEFTNTDIDEWGKGAVGEN